MPSRALSPFFRTISDTVAAGEKLVLGVPPSKRAKSPVRSRAKSPKGRAPLLLSGAGLLLSGGPVHRCGTNSSSGGGGNNSGSRGRPKARDFDFNPPENKHLFCSSMYTREFVLDAFQSVEQDKNVCSLEVEDLIQRNDADITTAAMDLLIDQALTESVKKNLRRSRKDRNADTKRQWTQIVFLDCISDANSYNEYQKLKLEFTTNLRQRLSLKGLKHESLPIRFEAKIELHTMLDVMGVIHLLEVVERDPSVKQVRFNGYRGKEKEIPSIFASMADPQTMEWKQSTDILIRYRSSRGSDSNNGGKTNKNPATDLVRKCIRALETVVFDVSMGDLDDEIEKKRKSRRGAAALQKATSGNTSSNASSNTVSLSESFRLELEPEN